MGFDPDDSYSPPRYPKFKEGLGCRIAGSWAVDPLGPAVQEVRGSQTAKWKCDRCRRYRIPIFGVNSGPTCPVCAWVQPPECACGAKVSLSRAGGKWVCGACIRGAGAKLKAAQQAARPGCSDCGKDLALYPRADGRARCLPCIEEIEEGLASELRGQQLMEEFKR